VVAAIILFVGTGGPTLSKAVHSLIGEGPGPDNFMASALLLNVALIIFGWRRYRDLCEELHQRRQAEENARRLAEIDPLTGLLNKRGFSEAMVQFIQSAEDRGQLVAAMMIDLDNFKFINDFYGHHAGDLLLAETAAKIGRILPQGSPLGRFGGDEFACAIAFDRAKPETVEQWVEALLEAIRHPVEANGSTLEATGSVGIARSDEEFVPASQQSLASNLLEMADIAMYQAKRRDRGSFHWFEKELRDEMRVRYQLETAMRHGIRTGEFVPYYQQLIDIQTGELAGFEMLARWNSSKFGLIGPDVFIPIAEEIGVIAELSESVISQALADAREWNPELTLAVNISPLQLRDPWFAQKLLKMLISANFPPERLEVEITETNLHEDITLVRSLMASMKNQGIRVSIDDFGTGFTSINQLRELPFDRIKIDRGFVTTLIDRKDNAAIVDAIATLGQGLGMTVTAEGIETEEILERLRTYGNIRGQGFLYGQPQSAAETMAWLARREESGADAATSTGSTPTVEDDGNRESPRQAGTG